MTVMKIAINITLPVMKIVNNLTPKCMKYQVLNVII